MIEWIVKRLIALIPKIQEMKLDKRALADAAASNISRALNETKRYYAGIERGLQRNIEREEELSELWAMAAVSMRHIDAELAQACDAKAEYWLNPEGWTPEQVRQAGIALERVSEHYRNELRPRGFQRPLYRRTQT